jgi:acrylyl-CoA reductase (NADPH)
VVEKKGGGGESSVAIREFSSVESIPSRGGDLLIRVTHSSLNYKDALAVTGKGKVLRQFPIVPGIDLAGVVEDPGRAGRYQAGDRVLVTGRGIGEQYSGGYARYCGVDSEWALPIPGNLDPHSAMALGTAGFTAMLCILALESHGLEPHNDPVLVTGGAGGVGSISIALLSKLGYRVTTSTGRLAEQGEYLTRLGATEILSRQELAASGRKPLEPEKWAGAVDSVGGETLASILRQLRYRGSVAACGLAGGVDLPTTVFPFILRGVNLLGIDSVQCPRALREKAWERLSGDIDLKKLEFMTQTVSLKDLMKISEAMLLGKVRGRVVVDLSR